MGLRGVDGPKSEAEMAGADGPVADGQPEEVNSGLVSALAHSAGDVVSILAQGVARGVSLPELIDGTLIPCVTSMDEVVNGTLGLASRNAVLAMAQLAPTGRPARAPGVLVAGNPDDLHVAAARCVLGAAAVASSLEELEKAVASEPKPACILVCASQPFELPGLYQVTQLVAQHDVATVAWGPAFADDPGAATAIGAEGLCETLAELPEAVSGAPRSPSPSANPRRRELELLLALSSDLVDKARVGGTDAETEEWAREVATEMLLWTQASVILADPGPLREWVTVQLGRMADEARPQTHLLGLLDSVLRALPPGTPSALEYLTASSDDLTRKMLAPRGVTGSKAQAGKRAMPVRNVLESLNDLLFLAVRAAGVPSGLLSLSRAQDSWTTLSYGFADRVGLDDPKLFEIASAHDGFLEIADLRRISGLEGSNLVTPPNSLRWAFCVPMGERDPGLAAVLTVLSRTPVTMDRLQRRAIVAAARQIAGTLATSDPNVISGEPEPGDETGDVVGPGTSGEYLRSGEVAELFEVSTRTVLNWAASGRLASLRTVGGHLRFPRREVARLMASIGKGRPLDESPEE